MKTATFDSAHSKKNTWCTLEEGLLLLPTGDAVNIKPILTERRA